MPDEIDWSATTHDGNRRRQHEEFRARSFREKLEALEASGELVKFFASRLAKRRQAKQEPADTQ